MCSDIIETLHRLSRFNSRLDIWHDGLAVLCFQCCFCVINYYLQSTHCNEMLPTLESLMSMTHELGSSRKRRARNTNKYLITSSSLKRKQSLPVWCSFAWSPTLGFDWSQVAMMQSFKFLLDTEWLFYSTGGVYMLSLSLSELKGGFVHNRLQTFQGQF